MRNSRVQAVQNPQQSWGLLSSLRTASSISNTAGVHKHPNLYLVVLPQTAQFVHRIFSAFLSVKPLLLPTIHSTYNKDNKIIYLNTSNTGAAL